MAQSAKVQEPSMEEILASIRRIIADDETKAQAKVEAKVEAEAARPAPAAAHPAMPPLRAADPPVPPEPLAMSAMNQDEIDAMLSGFDAPPEQADDGKLEDTRGAVLDLTEAMTAPATPEPPVFRPVEENPEVFFAEEDMEPPAEEAPAPAPALAEEPQPMFASDADEQTLISSATRAAVDSAFNTLAHTVLVQNARTLEDLVQEMMRPMLKTWLDDNLPGLVERVVRAEIERVSRGRTG
jgi:cell pole-organizing protein PopZ